MLDIPEKPWYDNEEQQPWVSALEFTIVDVGTRGLSEKKDAMVRCVDFVHSGYGLKYDHNEGRATYVNGGKLNFTMFIDIGHSLVNCFDCSQAVATMGALVGVQATNFNLSPAGYIFKATFVGGIQANNPFFENLGFNSIPIVGPNDLIYDLNLDGVGDRSPFGEHEFVELEGKVYDATLGPGVAHKIEQPTFLVCLMARIPRKNFFAMDRGRVVKVILGTPANAKPHLFGLR